MPLDLERVPAQFFVNAEWLSNYAVISGRETNNNLEIIDVNHVVPPFSIHRTHMAEILFKEWRRNADWWE